MIATKISVIIPTCHRNDLLAKCLDCLAPDVQTLPAEQYEVIVTDDGSKSTAEQMVREEYPWVRWVEGPRRGPAANRNNGAKFAKGEWLAFTDDDCLPSKNWLTGYVSSINPGVLIYEGKVMSDEKITSPMEEAPINLSGGLFPSCNIMMEKVSFNRMLGFDENFPFPAMEDWDLHDRIKKVNLKIQFADTAIIHHPLRRCHWGSRYARLLESHAYIWYKQGHQSRFLTSVLLHMMLGRLRRIGKFPLSIDTIFATTSFFAEVLYLAPRVCGWEKKYRSHFENHTSNFGNYEAV